MALETIYKLQPDRTMQLRGFDRRGAAAAYYAATENSWSLAGVFRDMADFAVLTLWELDNVYEPLPIRYLPDSDFQGIGLSFDYSQSGLMPAESPLYQSVPWGSLAYVLDDANHTGGYIPLRGYMTLKSGTPGKAQAVVNIAGAREYMNAGDRVALWIYNAPFTVTVPQVRCSYNFFVGGPGVTHWIKVGGTSYSYTEKPGDDGAAIALSLASQVDRDPGVSAYADGNAVVIQAERDEYDAVNNAFYPVALEASDSNAPVTLYSCGPNAVAAAVAAQITGYPWTAAGYTFAFSAVADGTRITITCETAGFEGNLHTLYTEHNNGGVTFIEPEVKFTGGNSDGLTWTVNLGDLETAIETSYRNQHPGQEIEGRYIQRLWLTFAPRIPGDTPYTDTDWRVEVTNWTVTDPYGKRALKVAGPGSVLVHSASSWVEYTGSWNSEAGFYNLGWARASKTAGDKAVITYHCQQPHDLYLGTALYNDGFGSAGIRVDGDPETTLSASLGANQFEQVNVRRKLRAALPPGRHTVEITLKESKPFYLDYLQAVVPAGVSDPSEEYSDVSPAIDWDTDITYKLPPQRVLWILRKMGFHGDINEYIGVLWWNQRKRVAGTVRTVRIRISGSFHEGDGIFIRFGHNGTAPGVTYSKYCFEDAMETNAQRARHLVHLINALSVALWAEYDHSLGYDDVLVHMRSPLWAEPYIETWTEGSNQGSIGIAEGNLDSGAEGIWEVDTAQTPYLNAAATAWHKDFFHAVAAAGMTCTVACSMELLNPPDYPASGQVWSARFHNGIRVLTATGFGREGQATITGATNAAPIVLTAEAHGYESGDSINVEGVTGNTAANGVWTITVLDANRFSLNHSAGNGSYAGGGYCSRNLRTAHCAPMSKLLDYQKAVYQEIAGLMAEAGLTPWLQLGEFLWWFTSDRKLAVAGASSASPIVITTAGDHGLQTGETVIVCGVAGNTAANGTWTIAVLSDNTFALNGSSGNGAYAGGGYVQCGSMALYDADTTEAAQAALGRPLHLFHTQDDDPSANNYADANFLRARLESHAAGIIGHVKSCFPAARFEVLWPQDVNRPAVYHTVPLPFPQGGRLNSYLNLPASWQHDGGGLDRIKVECLSWGAYYRNLDLAKEGISYAFDTLAWPKSKVRYLIPWFNGGCPWKREYLQCRGLRLPHINFWALDHLSLLAWPVPLPQPGGRVFQL